LQKEWNDIKLQLSGKHMKCPKCKSGVSLIQDQLLEHNPDLLEKRKVDLKKEMELIQSSLSSIKQNINENKDTLSDIDSELHTISQFIKEYSTIEKSNQQYTLQEFQKQKESYQKLQTIQTSINNDIVRIKKEQQQLKELSHPRLKTKYQSISLIENKIKTIQISIIYESSKSEEEWLEYKDNLKKQLQLNTQELDLYKKELQEQTNIKNKIKLLESSIAQMSTIEDVSQDLQSKHEEREERYKKAEKFSSREQKINKYFADKQVYIRQSKLVNDYNQSLNDEKIAIRALSKAEELLEILVQTENEILDNILQTINREIEEWMDFLFQDGTSMTLMSYKETKDGDKKSCIDIRIHREGEDIPLDSLSGGEYDRVAFALFLAFYTTTSSGSLLMLDECFSSLHSELVEDIVERLKEKVNNGLILMTLHQANTGFFDVVMNVEK
jgi:DNA repair exonuclease SbcCD ATPase subunit